MKRCLLAGVRRAADALAFGAGDWRSDQRRDARDIRRDSREQGRETKQECVSNNNQSNASCRHDKRKTAAKVVRKPATKNGKSACSGECQIEVFCHRSLSLRL